MSEPTTSAEPSQGAGAAAPIERLQERIGYRFRDPALLERALTHTSFRNESAQTDVDNERLEFLGDAVLGCAVSELLFHRYPGHSEGELTAGRAMLVNSDALARQALELDLGAYLRLGRGEERSGGRARPSVLADAFESLVAALYLDGGYAAAQRFLAEHLGDRVDSVDEDQRTAHFKAKAQVLIQAQLRSTPYYELLETWGPPHERSFRVALRVSERSLAEGCGRSKKEAEEEAARAFYEAYEAGTTSLLPADASSESDASRR